MLAWVACGWIAGLALSSRVAHPAWALTALGVAVIVFFGARELEARSWRALLAGAALAAGLAYRGPPDPPTPPACIADLEGEVIAAAARRDGPEVDLEVARGRCVEGASPLSIAPGTRLRAARVDAAPGARLRLRARIAPVTRFYNPHAAWVPSTARVLDAFADPAPGARARVVEDASFVARAIHGLRRTTRRAFDTTLTPRAAGIARALVLGDGGAMDDEDADAIRNAGLAHALAVSGLHVAIVVGFLRGLLELVLARVSRLRSPRRAAALVSAGLALLYAPFAGGSPSAWRAALMTTLAFGLVALGRRPKMVAVTAASAIAMTAADATLIARPAWVLSIVATGALVTMASANENERFALLRSAWRTSSRATIATAPFVWAYFGGVPLVGLLTNVFLLPLAVALMPAAHLHAIVGAIGGPLVPVTGFAVEKLASALAMGARVAAALPWGRDLPPLDPVQALVVAALVVVVLTSRSRRRAWLALALGCAALVASEWALRHREQPTDRLRITFFDVGQGDAAWIDLPDGRLLLVDAGGGAGDPGRRVLDRFLRERRRRVIDLFVLSHPHPDHYGGLEAVAARARIRELWDDGQAAIEEPAGEANHLIERLRRRGTTIRRPAELCGRRHALGEVEARVLWPCPAADSGLSWNDNSFVVRLDFRGRSVLLTGDVERDAEAQLVGRRTPLAAEVLKVPHHGSRTSSTTAFLDAVRPSFAVISAGRSNRFGHPHAEVVARLTQRGIRVLRTDVVGGSILETDGRAWRVETALPAKIRAARTRRNRRSRARPARARSTHRRSPTSPCNRRRT